MERWGKFERVASPGLIMWLWPCTEMRGKMTMRIQQLDVICETKTLDNVFATVQVSVQFMVMKDKVKQAYYELTNPKDQMRAYVYDTLRAAICAMTLDQAFENKDGISDNIKGSLHKVFTGYGFEIHQALVTDISPNESVKHAMNEINSSKRIKEASFQRAEGEKVLKVKRAEADAESMHLSGLGVARSRHAIMDGLKESIIEFNSDVSGTTAADIMDLLILTQYFDTLQDVGKKPGTRVIFTGDSNAVRDGIMQSNASNK